jgi:hypothetical protein
MAAAKTYKLGEAITGLKYDVKNTLAIVGIDLPEPPIKAGDKGDKVKQLQAALVKLHRMTSAGETGTFDAVTAKALGAFMHDWGFKGSEGYDAMVRLALAHALNGEKPKQNVHQVPPVEPPPHKPAPPDDSSVRGKIVANALWGVANTSSIHYAETRPIPALHSPKHLPLTTDCSGFATLCYKWAGAPDPNGNGYNGQGYTGTMMAHMKHIPKSEVQKGDLVIFGRATGHHVCIVLEPGENPLLASHGGESGPLRISLNDEYAYQSTHGGDGITWLTVLDGSGSATRPKPSSHVSGSASSHASPSGNTTVQPRPPVPGHPSGHRHR